MKQENRKIATQNKHERSLNLDMEINIKHILKLAEHASQTVFERYYKPDVRDL